VLSRTDFLVVSHVGRTITPNNPDLSSCDYFFGGFLKEKIFPKKLKTVMELRALIIQACNETPEDMCRRVIKNITVRVEDVVIMNSLFTEDKSPCKGLPFCMLVSSIVTEIKILLIDEILDHSVCQSV
jgi:hypothetical protein